MRIVLDTNVLVAGLLSPHGPPAAVLRLIISGRAVVCFDSRILDEYRAVLQRPKFDFNEALTRELIGYLEATGELIAAEPLNLSLPDAADAMFIEVALAGAADHLVTGNLKHFPSRARRSLSVLLPRRFIDRVAR